MVQVLNKINAAVWGTPTLLLIFSTGILLSIRTDFFQLKYFKKAFKVFFKKNSQANNNKMTPLQSASTALSATMGTGNIVGVAGAITLGGPGVVFWMWVSAIFCMIIKFAEISLAVRYREQSSDGTYHGGAMYYIKNALPDFLKPLSKIFCLFGVVAAFGVGNITQINTVASSVSAMARTNVDITPRVDFLIKLLAGLLCAICCAFILKNDCSIGRFCEKIMPVMTLLYIGITMGAIVLNYSKIPSVLLQILIGAFKPRAVTGGVIGSAFIGVRFGMSRGVFSNEAGLGTAPIAYACSDGDEIELGLMGIMEVFIDTVVVCTLTALSILCVGDVTYGQNVTDLTLISLTAVYGKNIVYIFCPIVCFFAFSSTIGWGLYGTKFITFLFGKKSKKFFLSLFILAQIPAAVFRAEVVWILAEILNGLMALPNISALLFLNDEVAEMTAKNKTNPSKI